MRDKLIKILQDMGRVAFTNEEKADYLIEAGVIVPPVYVGQTVWYIEGGYYRKTRLKAVPITVTEINQKWHGKILCWGFIANGTRYRFSSIGKTAFLTKEAAEQAIAERQADNDIL